MAALIVMVFANEKRISLRVMGDRSDIEVDLMRLDSSCSLIDLSDWSSFELKSSDVQILRSCLQQSPYGLARKQCLWNGSLLYLLPTDKAG